MKVHNSRCHQEVFQNVCTKFVDEIWSEDDMINCFKNHQPCKSGKEILEFHLSILSEKDEKPLTDINAEDINMTATVIMSIDSDQEDHEDMKVC